MKRSLTVVEETYGGGIRDRKSKREGSQGPGRRGRGNCRKLLQFEVKNSGGTNKTKIMKIRRYDERQGAAARAFILRVSPEERVSRGVRVKKPIGNGES